MVASVRDLLKKIDDLRSAAHKARAFAEHLDSSEAREGILQLAEEWERLAAREEDQVLRHSRETELAE